MQYAFSQQPPLLISHGFGGTALTHATNRVCWCDRKENYYL